MHALVYLDELTALLLQAGLTIAQIAQQTGIDLAVIQQVVGE